MKLIVGLGNPGEKYKNNRHNVGFMFLDYLIKAQISKLKTQNHNLKLKTDKYLSSLIFQASNNLLFIQPQTFINRSGTAVKSCVKRYALNVTQDVIVIHDDLDIPMGKFKIQKGSGPKLHNGIESIEKSLETKDFLRVRIGIDNRQKTSWVDGETYVLQDFLPEEKKLLVTEIFPKIFTRTKLEIF